jgi:type II secretory pathway pseudopilin PulG
MNRHRPAPGSRASEAGFALLEVIVSAAVLALVAVAVLAGIDGAQSSTGREKSRSVAANLAEQDQERMRSLQVDSLADYTETRNVNVDGSTYQVVSTGTWVRDDTGGTISCQNNSKQADYLQITSTVTNSSVGYRTAPVAISSLVAPSVAYSSTRGSLAVQVNDRDGVGVPGLMVAIDGPSSDSAQTNGSGCAVFQYIAVGNYNITLNRPGWVDHFGNTTSVGNQDVTAGTLNVRSMDYDEAATAVATIGTYKPGSTDTSSGNLIPSTAPRVSATNSGEPGMLRNFTSSPASGATTINLTNLFPFADEYGVFTGACDEANPTNYDADYFPNYTGSVLTDPAGTHAVTVRQPPLNFRLRDNSGNYINNGTVKMTLRTDTAECTEPTYVLTTADNPYITSGSLKSGYPTEAGQFDPGLPFGMYNMCLEYKSGGRWRHYQTTTAAQAYDNTPALGQPNTSSGTPMNLPPNTTDWSSQTTTAFC